MSHANKQTTYFPNLKLGPHGSMLDGDVGKGIPTSAAAGAVLQPGMATLRRDRIRFDADVVITVTAANDFGGVKLLDLPATNLQFFGARMDVTAEGTGGLDGALANVDLALGQVTTASVAFTNAGEDNMIGAVQMSAGGVAQGGGFIAGFSLFAAQGVSPEVHLNVGVDPGVADGTLVIKAGSVIDLLYVDIGQTTPT